MLYVLCVIVAKEFWGRRESLFKTKYTQNIQTQFAFQNHVIPGYFSHMVVGGVILKEGAIHTLFSARKGRSTMHRIKHS